MRSKFLTMLFAVLLVAVMAAPAMAMKFAFSGPTAYDLIDPLGTPTEMAGVLTFGVDTGLVSLATGSVEDLIYGTIDVTYYGGLAGSVTTAAGTFGIVEQLYVAYSSIASTGETALTLGLWTPGMFGGWDGFTTDVIGALDAPAGYDMMSNLGPLGSTNFVYTGFLNLTNGGALEILQPIPGQVDVPHAWMVYSASVPEPSMFLLFGAGLLGLGIFRKKM